MISIARFCITDALSQNAEQLRTLSQAIRSCAPVSKKSLRREKLLRRDFALSCTSVLTKR